MRADINGSQRFATVRSPAFRRKFVIGQITNTNFRLKAELQTDHIQSVSSYIGLFIQAWILRSRPSVTSQTTALSRKCALTSCFPSRQPHCYGETVRDSKLRIGDVIEVTTERLAYGG